MSTYSLGELLRKKLEDTACNAPSTPSQTGFDIKFVENSTPPKVVAIDKLRAIILLRALINCSYGDAKSLLDQNIQQMTVNENGDPAVADLAAFARNFMIRHGIFNYPNHILPSKRK